MRSVLILGNESEPRGCMLLLIKPSRTTAEPPDPTPPMQKERRPSDPAMGGLPPDIDLPAGATHASPLPELTT
ncbi:MAG TPA: hypothetical protein PLU87_09030 [Sedimentisphaerales bacterium]|nr:hypothetical protein [Sedimentisphaerales bacterium]